MNPRLGRCYELSYQFATSHEGFSLVHGYISTRDGSRVIDHAWTEKDGTVYDPVMDQELPSIVYATLLNAEETKRYSGLEAMKQGLESGTYGPWHDIPKGKRKHPDLRESSRVRESLSRVVYHATTCEKFKRILRDDAFMLSSSLGTDSDRFSTKYHYFMSLSTVKFGGFARAKESIGQVILVLDGDLLNRRYKGAPVDYWGPENRPSEILTPEDEVRHHKFDENEERLFTNDDEIPNALSYIKEAHVLVGVDGGKDLFSSMDDSAYQAVKSILAFAKSNGLKVYLYTDKQAYRAQAKSKAAYSTKEDDSFIVAILDAYKKGPSSLPGSFPYDRVKNALLYGDDVPGLIASVKCDVHNYRTLPEYRRQIVDLTNAIRKTKSSSIDEFIKGLLTVRK